MNISRLIIVLLLLSFVSVNNVNAANDRYLLTQKGYIGGFSKADCKKITGKITLEVYQPYIDNIKSHGYPNLNKTNKITIEYDEIWERKNTDLLSKAEIRKFKNNLDIVIVYLKNNQIQASVVKKKFMSNPLTNQKFPKPEYKIVSLETRAEVMKYY